MEPARLKHYLDYCKAEEILDNEGQPIGHMVTGPVRLAFTYLDKPKATAKGDRFVATIIIPSQSDLSVYKQLAGRAGMQRFGNAFVERVKKGELFWPLKPQSKLHDKGYKGFEAEGVFLECQSKYQVPVVDVYEKDLDPTDKTKVYSGMWALARIAVYAFPGPGEKSSGVDGVNFGLRGLMKLCDDEEFKGEAATAVFKAPPTPPGVQPPAAGGPAKAPAMDAFDGL